MLTALALTVFLPAAQASSHREAPAIAKDPLADITDLYAFLEPDNSNFIVFIMNVNPLQDPGGGPNFHVFDDGVRYSIHIDNEGDGGEDIRYDFEFANSTYSAPESFLYNFGDVASTANLNQVQTYDVTRYFDGATTGGTEIASGRTTAPVAVGEASVATDGYRQTGVPGTLTQAYTYSLVSGPVARQGYQLFAGPRQEMFAVDLGATFDLLNNFNVTPTNTLYGKNVSSIAIRVPVTAVTRNGLAPSTANQNEIIAVWATTSRQTATVIVGDGTFDHLGPYQQIGRLGNPLVNEAVIGLGDANGNGSPDKDEFNQTEVCGYPGMGTCDAAFLDYVLNPTLIDYMTALLGVPTPSDADCDKGLGLGGREDLVLPFLVGDPALGTLPSYFTGLGGAIPGESGKTYAAFEALRINLTGAGLDLDGDGDTEWPNGRDLDDDVVDVALSAEAGLLCASGGSGIISDGVDQTGLMMLNDFPWIGDPWLGDAAPWPTAR